MIEPFGPASGTHVEDLEIETDEDSLVVSGTLTIRRDRQGLERARMLARVMSDAVRMLEGQDLPDVAPSIAPGRPGPNPFGN